MLTETDKTLARMGATICALEQALNATRQELEEAKGAAQSDAAFKDKMIAELQAQLTERAGA